MDVLVKAVMVAGATAKPGRPLVEIPAGTSADDIDPVELAQLHPDHFVNVELVDGQLVPTGNPVAEDLPSRTFEMAALLRELDESPGVDSTEHVDPKDVKA